MLKQTLFFSKPCKLSFRLKQLVEEEKRYTTTSPVCVCRASCGLLKKRKDIQPTWYISRAILCCGLLKKRKDIQRAGEQSLHHHVVAC